MTTSKLKEEVLGHEAGNGYFKGHKYYILPCVVETFEWEKKK